MMSLFIKKFCRLLAGQFLGNAVLNHFLQTDIDEISIFLRDEKCKMICVKIKNTRLKSLMCL